MEQDIGCNRFRSRRNCGSPHSRHGVPVPINSKVRRWSLVCQRYWRADPQLWGATFALGNGRGLIASHDVPSGACGRTIVVSDEGMPGRACGGLRFTRLLHFEQDNRGVELVTRRKRKFHVKRMDPTTKSSGSTYSTYYVTTVCISWTRKPSRSMQTWAETMATGSWLR